MYNSNYHYNYESDFPRGNGWRGSQFYGEIIDSKDYVFQRGKYQGRTLQQVVGRAWQGIGKYIDYGLIYITNHVFDTLKCDEKKRNFLRVSTDAKLEFSTINSISDELYSQPYASWYQGKTFLDVAKLNPGYLWGLIYRCYNSVHGDNSHYYATDNGLPLNHIEDIIDELKSQSVNPNLINRLQDLSDEINEREQEARDWADAQWQREMDRQLIEDGYREAYNDDPDAQWNTD